MSDLREARLLLEQLQRSTFTALAEEAPTPIPPRYSSFMVDYLKTNPDYDAEAIPNYAWDWQDKPLMQLLERSDLSPLSGSLSILADLVDDLKRAYKRLDPTLDLSNICFGTVPGGGLDAFTFKVPGKDQYGVVIPEGFFHLANLVTKVVVLLQPIHDGSYLPTASLEQMARRLHPYVRFRVVDLLRAYALNGEPMTALPYWSAIPFQDRFRYLLHGAELHLLAHEAGHVLLGHLADDGPAPTADQELEADAFALRVVTSHFASLDEFSEARASLCGFLFNGLIRLWENMIHLTYGEDVNVFRDHPTANERYRNFQTLLEEMSGPTPEWYGFVLTGVSFAVVDLPDALLPAVVTGAVAGGGLHARVVPVGSQLPARYSNMAITEQWWRTIAGLVLGEDQRDRRLGLWFLLVHQPESAEALYRGLLDDDPEWAAMCQNVLISIKPMYGSYLSRLREEFREADQQDGLNSYLGQISQDLLLAAQRELRPLTRNSNPMLTEFFAEPAEDSGVPDRSDAVLSDEQATSPRRGRRSAWDPFRRKRRKRRGPNGK